MRTATTTTLATLALCAGLGASGDAAARAFRNPAFDLKLPTGWRHLSTEDAGPGRGTRFVFSSQTGLYRLRVRVIPSTGQPFGDEVARAVRRLQDRLPGFAVLDQKHYESSGRNRFILMGTRKFTPDKKRKETVDAFLIRAMARSPKRTLFFHFELTGSLDRLPEAAEVFEALFDGFDVKDPKPKTAAVSKKGGAR